ncbi:MAG: hypothetical protein WC813_04315 [Patescibacteria group bacterium]|jgi:hypothetical protein
MLLPTVHDPRTEIHDDAIECLLSGRIFRITAKVHRYMLKEGMILMWNKKQSLFQLHDNADNAYRACFHTMGTYGWNDVTATEGELRRIEDISAKNMELCYFLFDWKTMKPAQRKQYEQTSLEIAAELKDVTDEHKVRMRDWTLQAATVRDSLGRTNPNVAGNRQSGSAREGEQRAANIREICKRYDPRKVVLWEEIRKNESDLRKVLTAVRSVLDMLNRGPVSAAPLLGSLPPLVDILGRTHDLQWRHAFRKSANDLKAATNAAMKQDHREIKKRLHWVEASLGNLEKERELAQWRLETAMAVSRRPHRNDELKLQFDRLVAFRQSCEVTPDGKWKTEVMNRFREGLDNAILAWPHVHASNRSFELVSAWLDESIVRL